MASFSPPGADQLADELRHLGRRQGPTPRTPKYSRTQIIEILKVARDGAFIKDLCREYGITDSTFYRWRTRYGQALSAAAPPPGTPEQQLRHVEAENRRLRRLLANAERLSA
jgi:putative transposase